MPIIAIGAAIIADVGVGLGGFGAVLAGTAGLTTTLEVVGAVGATLNAVGAITHDKGLSTAGMILGGIGGIGALASSAGLFGADAAAGTDSLFGSSSVEATPETFGSNIGGYASGAAGAPSPDIVQSLNPESQGISSAGGVSLPPSANVGIVSPDTAPGTNFGSVAQDADAQSLLPSGSGPPVGGAVTPPPINAAPLSPTAIAGGTSAAPVQAPGTPAVPVTGAPAPPVAATTSAPATPASSTGGLVNWLSNTKGGSLATYGLIQAGGSFITGAFSTLTPAQVNQLNAQAAANQAAANLSNKQLANTSEPIPVASRMPSTGGGLINSPPPTVAVTGAPA